MNQLAPLTVSRAPALVVAAGPRASYRFLEFFTAQIRNPHTRRAYARAATEFFDWLAGEGRHAARGDRERACRDLHRAVEKARSAPTAKLRLAALRHLFDWMVIGQIMPTNPAAAVRGPRHIVRRGKTPVLDPAEARQLIDAIDASTVIGLRDRALIGLMVYSFARIGAAIGMRVEDVYTQNRRLWVRLHEKGGKQHAMPCHHNLEAYLHAYIDGAGLASDPKALLFPDLQPRDRPAHRQSPAPGERLCDDPAPRAGGRDHDQDRQPHVSRDGRHRLPQERRNARKGGADGEPRQHAHDAALRSARRGSYARRGGADTRLKLRDHGEAIPSMDERVREQTEGKYSANDGRDGYREN